MSPDLEYSFTLPRLVLRALALFQASSDRPSLACTSLELKRNGLRHTLTLCATNGRRLATYSTEISADTLFGKFPKVDHLVLDLTGTARLPKVPEGDCITLEVYAKHVEIVADSLRYTSRRLEAEVIYPSWRQVVPDCEAISLTQFAVNFELLADFGRCAKWLSEGSPSIALRSFGEGAPIAVLLPGCPEFFGIIMPLKFDAAAEIPDWLRAAHAPVAAPTVAAAA